MTRFQANFVKYLRVRCDGFWRWVAGKYIDRYEHNEPFTYEMTCCGNQIFGLQLCDEAMNLLNEKVEDGWN